MKKKPPYALGSVDNALRILQMLRDQGSLRVSDAAAELGIARSTAHRLLSMLVYRDFAVQDDQRTYQPGPALAAGQVGGRPLQQLRRALTPHLEALCERVEETVNLMARVGTQARFLASVEGPHFLRVGDRQGTVLPACRASGGKALLAEMSIEELELLYRPSASAEEGVAADDPSTSELEWKKLLHELEGIRACGYALNVEGTETGVVAVGMCVHGANGRALGAMSISAPSARFGKERIPELVRELSATVQRADEDLKLLPELSA